MTLRINLFVQAPEVTPGGTFSADIDLQDLSHSTGFAAQGI